MVFPAALLVRRPSEQSQPDDVMAPSVSDLSLVVISRNKNYNYRTNKWLKAHSLPRCHQCQIPHQDSRLGIFASWARYIAKLLFLQEWALPCSISCPWGNWSHWTSLCWGIQLHPQKFDAYPKIVFKSFFRNLFMYKARDSFTKRQITKLTKKMLQRQSYRVEFSELSKQAD